MVVQIAFSYCAHFKCASRIYKLKYGLRSAFPSVLSLTLPLLLSYSNPFTYTYSRSIYLQFVLLKVAIIVWFLFIIHENTSLHQHQNIHSGIAVCTLNGFSYCVASVQFLFMPFIIVYFGFSFCCFDLFFSIFFVEYSMKLDGNIGAIRRLPL